MANISKYLAQKLLGHAMGKTTFTPGTNLYIRFSTTETNSAGASWTELTNGGYSPQVVTNNTTNFPVPTDGVGSNAVRFDFDAATEDWDPIRSVGFWDDPTAGNLWWFENRDVAHQIEILDTQNAYYDIGDLDYTLS